MKWLMGAERRTFPRSAVGTATEALVRLSARELSERTARGDVTAEKVVDAHIARIEEVNPALNAVVLRRYDEARAEAKVADRRRAAGKRLGPLHGVPITVKECLDLTGTPSTFGVVAHRGDVATADDPYVARLRRAGAIVIGKTNVAQLLVFLETDNPVYGRTQNPWDLERSPGGSSGGEAAIIASFGSPLGLGTDIGGSSRNPAMCTGIVGFKPTAGRLPDVGRGSVPIGQRAIQSQVGLLARHVDDVALGLAVANDGPSPEGDPPRPLGDPLGVDVSTLTVGWFADDPTFPACHAAQRAVREAAQALAARGARVVPFAPPRIDRAIELFYGICSGDGGRGMLRFLDGSAQDPRVRRILGAIRAPGAVRAALRLVLRLTNQRKVADIVRIYGRYTTVDYWDRVEQLAIYRQHFLAALDDGEASPIDVLLSPASALPALRHGAAADLGVIGGYALLYNVLGYPAGVVPMTRVRPDEETAVSRASDKMDRVAREMERGSAGLPVGVQVAARPFCDHVALAVMAALEKAARERPDYPTLHATSD